MISEELEALNHVLTVKEKDTNNEQQKVRKILISVSYFLL